MQHAQAYRLQHAENKSACDRAAHIPIASESLNAAMAATVAVYELTREPTHQGEPSRNRVPEAPC